MIFLKFLKMKNKFVYFSQTPTMNEIAEDCLVLIFEYIKLSQLVNLKLVNKRFLRLIHNKYQEYKIDYQIDKDLGLTTFFFKGVPSGTSIFQMDNIALWKEYIDPTFLLSDFIFSFDNRLDSRAISYNYGDQDFCFKIQDDRLVIRYVRRDRGFYNIRILKNCKIESLKLLYDILSYMDQDK